MIPDTIETAQLRLRPFGLRFATYAHLNRLRAMADARNVGSLRVMEKLGMTREGVLRQNRRVRGEFIDETWCGVLRSEWKAQRHLR